jgi:hypothetical protein
MATYQWDPISQAIINLMGPGVVFVEQFGFIGEKTHFVKLPALVCA